MGVVLTHNNEKTNIRKYLQVAPSKTTKLTRRGSIQPPPKENPPAKVDVKRNMSFQSSSPPPLRNPGRTTPTVEAKSSADAGKPASPVGRSQKENAKVPVKQNAVPLSVTKTTNEVKPSPAAAATAAIPKPPVIVEPSKQEAKASLRNTIQEPNKTPEQNKATSQPSRNSDKQPMKVQEPDKTKPSVLGSTAKEPTRLQEQEKKVAQPPRSTVQATNKSPEGGLRASILPKEQKLNSDKQPIKIQEPEIGKPLVPGSAAKELTRLQEQEKATKASEGGPRAPIPPKENKLNSTAPAPAAPKPTSPQPQNWLITKQSLPPPTASTTASSSRRTSTTSTASTASSARAAAQNLVAVKMASLSKNTTTLASRIQAFSAAAEAAENKTRRKKFSLYQ
ncbi:unnamed protein product [Dibothriocephalus latus]|uniref:Uncharacterized protein n=1 Tax=Dibothriocephalus latus TaxID=60516 RepID=A0A3P7LT11_DIBLA|nr:unnamed protein product [Dibothriocephalus latus]